MRWSYWWILLLALVMAISLWLTMTVWHECRETHTWLYCYRVVIHR